MAKVGGEVDAWCTKCEMNLAHTIIAMLDGRPVKVECNTCHGVHKYRPAPGSAAAPERPRSKRAPREKPSILSFDEVLRSKNLAGARKYSPKARFAEDDVIEHPTFGLGYVSGVRPPDKIDVTFRTEVKTLIHGRS